ncbi:tRNA (adenosine(37)-N6)-threonylcarbamoyltransferase complex ATPase subunit type 1 TsaE [Candidatus Uhrbacteria bacterium]|nr:tRNA (adenosine(37)-N6)-threonylcarbamoyltransferase complex ATPase subunit type 1 TsaE [Candidatus Uhrbacteria bacterium]
MTHTTRTEEETKKIAAEFTSLLNGGEVVFLQGELGSGKTTFVRGVAEAFGFHEPVRSPSFTIVNRYPVDHAKIKQILHVDFYRIEDPSEILPLALEEEVGRADTVTFIEWPENAQGRIFQPLYRIQFLTQGDVHSITLLPLPR